MKLLLVEDDYPLASVLADALEESGYIVDLAHDGETAWCLANEHDYPLLLLDFMLPKLDGVTLCQRLRAQGCTTPILMMTARDASNDKVYALDAGADDYLVKPVDLPELLARIRALLRRGQVQSSMATWGDLSLNPSLHQVTYAQKPILLTPTEFSLLELFIHNGQRVLSRPMIISQLWDLNDPPGEETVKAHIKGLRHKLRKAGAPNNFIETVRGVGYRLQAPGPA